MALSLLAKLLIIESDSCILELLNTSMLPRSLDTEITSCNKDCGVEGKLSNLIWYLQMHSGERLFARKLEVAAHHQIYDSARLLSNL